MEEKLCVLLTLTSTTLHLVIFWPVPVSVSGLIGLLTWYRKEFSRKAKKNIFKGYISGVYPQICFAACTFIVKQWLVLLPIGVNSYPIKVHTSKQIFMVFTLYGVYLCRSSFYISGHVTFESIQMPLYLTKLLAYSVIVSYFRQHCFYQCEDHLIPKTNKRLYIAYCSLSVYHYSALMKCCEGHKHKSHWGKGLKNSLVTAFYYQAL